MIQCPTCDSEDHKRIPRKLIYKLFPGTKAYKCSKCYTKFVWFPMTKTRKILKKA